MGHYENDGAQLWEWWSSINQKVWAPTNSSSHRSNASSYLGPKLQHKICQSFVLNTGTNSKDAWYKRYRDTDLSKCRILKDIFSFFEKSSSVIDVFAGRQRRDRSIGEEVKVEPRESQGNALGKIEVKVKIKVEPRECFGTSWS